MKEVRHANIGIVGMGAAGCMAGIAASQPGVSVALFDGNEKPGKKIYITGKGRCNVTNATALPEFLQGIAHNGRFLYSAMYRFSNADLMAFLESEGLKLKIERGQRVFPASDHSSDVIRTLEKALRERNAKLYYHHLVTHTEYLPEQNQFALYFEDEPAFFVDRLILACGGQSYPSTGSRGDGIRFASRYGHAFTTPTPSLVPILLEETEPAHWEGISLRNVEISAPAFKKVREFGEMVFTRQGVSGPAVLRLSAQLAGKEIAGKTLTLDWKPALSIEQLRQRLQREREKGPNRSLSTLFASFLPRRVVPDFLARGGWASEQSLHDWKREEAERFLELLKAYPFTMRDFAPFTQAIVTHGGVKVKEVDPHTMQSRLQPGLYLAGEMLDVEGFTGGYNLQIAFSTGHLAGESAAADWQSSPKQDAENTSAQPAEESEEI